MKRVTLPDAEVVPSMSQGTWKMGERAERRSDEIAALRAGVELGLTLIDTAEMYDDGAAETLICEAVGSLRDQLFLVSKAYPQNASRSRLAGACEASLKRLGTDRLEREDTQPWPRHKDEALNKKAWMRRQSPPGGANRVRWKHIRTRLSGDDRILASSTASAEISAATGPELKDAASYGPARHLGHAPKEPSRVPQSHDRHRFHSCQVSPGREPTVWLLALQLPRNYWQVRGDAHAGFRPVPDGHDL